MADFEEIAENTIEHLFAELEDQVGNDIEIDYNQGVLQIEVPDGGTYVINKHHPTEQLWLSSPVSGAWHFHYDESTESWLSTRDDSDLYIILASELESSLSVDIDL